MDSTAYPEQIENAQDDRYIRIVGFDSLGASAFLHLLREVYYENNPMVEDFQVYHLFKNIHLTLRDEDGNTLDYTQDNTVDPEELDLNKCLSYTD